MSWFELCQQRQHSGRRHPRRGLPHQPDPRVQRLRPQPRPAERQDENLSGSDVREGLICVISVKLQEAEFEGQTKAKLGNTEIRTLVSNMVYTKLMEFFEENPGVAKANF